MRNLDPTFLSLFSLSFVLPSTICLVSWIPRIPVLCSPALSLRSMGATESDTTWKEALINFCCQTDRSKSPAFRELGAAQPQFVFLAFLCSMPTVSLLLLNHSLLILKVNATFPNQKQSIPPFSNHKCQTSNLTFDELI